MPVTDVIPYLGEDVPGHVIMDLRQAQIVNASEIILTSDFGVNVSGLLRTAKFVNHHGLDLSWVGDNRGFRRMFSLAHELARVVYDPSYVSSLTFDDIFGLRPSGDYTEITAAALATTPDLPSNWPAAGAVLPTFAPPGDSRRVVAPVVSLVDGAGSALAGLVAFLRAVATSRNTFWELLNLIARHISMLRSLEVPVIESGDPPGRVCARSPRSPRAPSTPQATPASCGLALL